MSEDFSTIPPLLLERALLGEFSSTELQDLRRRFGPGFDGALEELSARDERFRQSRDFEIELQQVKDRVAKTRPMPSRPLWRFTPALAAVATLAIVVWAVAPKDPGPQGPQIALGERPEPAQEVRLKGLRSHLTLHRKVGDGQEALDAGAMVRQGDVIQLSYVAVTATFGVIFSIDGRGQVTQHFPSSSQQSAALARQGATPLAQAYELDDAPGFERFFFVSIDKKEAPAQFVANVMQKAQEFANGPSTRWEKGEMEIPKEWFQASFALKKPSGR